MNDELIAAAAVDVVVAGDAASVPHSRFDWVMSFFAVLKFGKIQKN